MQNSIEVADKTENTMSSKAHKVLLIKRVCRYFKIFKHEQLFYILHNFLNFYNLQMGSFLNEITISFENLHLKAIWF